MQKYIQCPECRGVGTHKSYGHHRTYVEPCARCFGEKRILAPLQFHSDNETLFKFDSCVSNNRRQFLDKDIRFTQDDLYPKAYSDPFL